MRCINPAQLTKGGRKLKFVAFKTAEKLLKQHFDQRPDGNVGNAGNAA
jgi:hypothetical protein